MNDSIIGENVLTVLYSKPPEGEELHRKMFFCPYTKNITVPYQGKVQAIEPGYDPEDTPQIFVLPAGLNKATKIRYTFRKTNLDGESVDFYIQDHYFKHVAVQPYHCYNCQAPNLYFSENRAVHFRTKADVKHGESFECINPLCKTKFTYHGIVAIREVGNYDII